MSDKISGYPVAATAFEDGDLFDVSKRVAVSPDVFESQRMPYSAMLAFVQANGSNLFTVDAQTLPANRIHQGGGNLFSIQDVQLAFQGFSTNPLAVQFLLAENGTGNPQFSLFGDGNTLIGNGATADARLHVIGNGSLSTDVAFRIEDDSVSPDTIFDVRGSGQIGYGGAYISTDAHAFRNPNSESTILAAYNGVDQRFRVNSSGHLQVGISNSSWQHRMRAQSGVGYFEMRNTSNVQSLNFETGDNSWFNKPIHIGNNAGVSNDVLLELTSTSRAFRIMRMTVIQAATITPLDAMIIYVTDTDATFTSVGFWGYENGAWVKL